MVARKAAVAVARKLVTLMYSMLKHGTLFTVENEEKQQEVAAYHARKNLQVIGRYNKIRKSCKGYSEMVAITHSMTIDELGVFTISN